MKLLRVWYKIIMLLPVSIFINKNRQPETLAGKYLFPDKFSPKLLRAPVADTVSFKAAVQNTCAAGSGSFKNCAMDENNPDWSIAIKRYTPIEKKNNDIRTEFERDRNRIMHSEGFDRLRFKTQVFPVCENDMVSTRSTHVLQVSDIARNISKKLGLNEDLTETIAMGHDIGHSPFGHDGEKTLNSIAKKEGLPSFWHEKNSLRMIDNILTLLNSKGQQNNLGLTYAVRDGIINHCGELDQNFIKPRKTPVDLYSIQKAGEVEPYSWEGVVVKISDKIAYIGRDIEDATKLGILTDKNHQELNQILKTYLPDSDYQVNNTSLISLFVNDLVKNSSPQKGIGFSKPVFDLMNAIKKYNYEHIYLKTSAKKINQSGCDKIITAIYNHYLSFYNGSNTIENLSKTNGNKYNANFKDWLVKYSANPYRPQEYQNKIIYDLNNPQDYKQAVIDYISGMTDKYAISTYESIISH